MIDNILKTYSIQGNWVDLIFIVLVVYFLLSSAGFIESFLELAGFLLSIILAYTIYPFFGRLLVYNFSLPPGIANAIGFFVGWSITEIIVSIIINIFAFAALRIFREHRFNRALRFLPALFHACIIFLFFVSLVFSLPVRGWIKEDILNSKAGPLFVNFSQSLELRMKNVFGKAVSESLNFLTIKPKSTDTLDLGFKLGKNRHHADPESEKTMIDLLNKERSQRNIHTLKSDETLRTVARKYASHMLEYGFFSHVSKIDGSSGLERTLREDAKFTVVGENLAFAPDVYLAHQGLMNSEGHRKNILSEEYGRVGIGVIDGGVYGKMFVQVFTD